MAKYGLFEQASHTEKSYMVTVSEFSWCAPNDHHQSINQSINQSIKQSEFFRVA